MSEIVKGRVKTAAELFVDALIRAGKIKSEDDLTAEQLEKLKELNQNKDLVDRMNLELENDES